MNGNERLKSWRTWARHNERPLAGWYLAAVAVLCLLFLVPAVRDYILGGLQGLAQRADRRWDARVARGARLVDSGQYAEAIRYLVSLDRVFPAPSEQHARDRQREDILRMLAKSYEAAHQPEAAMVTYDRLIQYAPRDYVNLYLKARAAERMAASDSSMPSVDPRIAYLTTLKLFPGHLPSVRGAVRAFARRGDAVGEVAVYRSYADAFLVQHITLACGPASTTPGALVDGAPHPVELDVDVNHADTLRLSPRGFAVAIDSVILVPAAQVGAVPGAPVKVAINGTGERMTRGSLNAWIPADDSSAVRIPLGWRGPGRIRVVLRLFKPVDRPTWEQVMNAWRRLPDAPALNALAARTVPFETEREADLALARLGWAERAGYDTSGTR